MGTLHDLSRADCEALLRDHQVGRVGLVAPDGPHVIPVNYAVVEDAVVFRTSPFTLLATHGRDAQIAFEVDQIDQAGRSGWSVLVRGRCEVVFDSREIALIRQAWEPVPWADGSRNFYMRLRMTGVSGRQIGDLRPVPSVPR